MTGGRRVSTVVGYQGKDVSNGLYNYMTATFQRVDKATPTLADLVPDSETYVYSTLSFLEPTTGATKKFDIEGVGNKEGSFCYYFTADLEGTEYEGLPGWYFVDDDSNIHPCNNIEVPFGSMFYLEGLDDPDTKLVFNGQVANEDTPVAVVNGNYNYTGNCTPKDLTLADLIPDPETYVYSTLSFLDPASGATKKFDIEGVGNKEGSFCYYFVTDLEGTEYEGQPGWYFVDDDSNIHPCNYISVAAGSMIYLEGLDDPDTSIIIPSAL